jgi:hypothetical protein
VLPSAVKVSSPVSMNSVLLLPTMIKGFAEPDLSRDPETFECEDLVVAQIIRNRL